MHQPTVGMTRGKYGPHTELFFFIIRKEPFPLTEAVQFQPFVSAESLKACALVGLHFLAAEDDAGSSGGQSLALGDIWRCGCPKRFDWVSDVESWTESEGTSSSQQCEHDVESRALNVMSKNRSGEKISLFLVDWEFARAALR